MNPAVVIHRWKELTFVINVKDDIKYYLDYEFRDVVPRQWNLELHRGPRTIEVGHPEHVPVGHNVLLQAHIVTHSEPVLGLAEQGLELLRKT